MDSLSSIVQHPSNRIIVAITGASGAVYGIRLLKTLGQLGIERHLIVSRSGWITLHQELGLQRANVLELADVVHDERNIGACIASGSYRHAGMVIAPCSMRTLAAVAHGLSDNLVSRAADVTLKERRPLLMMVRETPLNLAHLRNMVMVTEMGARVMPPVPAFYARPASIEEMVDYTVARVVDQLGLDATLDYDRWQGLRKAH